MPSRSRSGFVLPALGLIAALVWAMVRSGFIMTPVPEDLVQAAEIWPERTESWMTQFYADSPPYILVSRVLGIDDAIGLIRQSLVVGLIAIILLAAWTGLQTDNGRQLRGMRLAILAPVSAVLFSTMGSYDAFTALAWGVALWAWWSHSRILMVAGGVLLGLQHFEQALLGAAALILTWFALRDGLADRLRGSNPAWLIPGILTGKVLLVLLLFAAGSEASGRTDWLAQYVGDWTKVGIATLPSLIWALFAGLWLLIVLVWSRCAGRTRWLLMGSVALGLLGTFMSGDRPRVFVLIILPSLLLVIVHYLRDERPALLELRSVEAMAWLAPPLILAGKGVANANIFDDAYVSFMWITGLGGPG